MKLRFQNRRDRALTLVEVLVIIVVIAVLAVMLLPPVTPSTRVAQRINCLSNLEQVGMSFRIWAGDNDNKYPMSVSVTNGGAMELIAAGNVAGCLQVMSNELTTPKILVCPADLEHPDAATNFMTLNNSNISYFINPDASEAYPQMLMSGDDNLAVDDAPVKSGLVEIPFKEVSWTLDRHGAAGNILWADGSISEISSSGLKSAAKLSIQGTPITTNRLAIP